MQTQPRDDAIPARCDQDIDRRRSAQIQPEKRIMDETGDEIADRRPGQHVGGVVSFGFDPGPGGAGCQHEKAAAQGVLTAFGERDKVRTFCPPSAAQAKAPVL